MGMGVLGAWSSSNLGLIMVLSKASHPLDSSVERNHANMRGATYGIVGEFRSRHDDSLVRRKITIPVFKMLDSVRSGTMKRAPRSVFFAWPP